MTPVQGLVRESGDPQLLARHEIVKDLVELHVPLLSKLDHPVPFYPQATFSEDQSAQQYNDPDLESRVKSEPSYLNLPPASTSPIPDLQSQTSGPEDQSP